MRICLYGASSTAIAQHYIDATEQLGELMARAGYSLVYGGGGAGLMGAAARGVKRGGGHIIGVVPSFLKVDGVLFSACDEMIYTDTMRERKQIMEDYADAFVVAPGGIGTYEEFFEIYTAKQLGRLHKPIVLFNIDGYYDTMQRMLTETVERQFMRPASLSLITVATTPQEVLAQLAAEDAVMPDIHDTKYV